MTAEEKNRIKDFVIWITSERIVNPLFFIWSVLIVLVGPGAIAVLYNAHIQGVFNFEETFLSLILWIVMYAVCVIYLLKQAKKAHNWYQKYSNYL